MRRHQISKNAMAQIASPDDAVSRTLEVACSDQRAFEVFASQMGRWWPAAHHIGSAPFRDICIEPFVGGAWYEVDAAGNRCLWGRVLAYQPPHRLVLAWQLNTEFNYDPDIARASEVELRFIALTRERTRVEFEHRHLHRHGAGFEEMTRQVGSDNGWGSILGAYVMRAQSAD